MQSKQGINKVLVCITPQYNSRRLIDAAHGIALENGGELYILHVETRGDLFITEDSAVLLQELYNHGAELGGVVRGICAPDVAEAITSFIKKEKITHVMLGSPPENAEIKSMDICTRLKTVLPHVNFCVLERGD